MMESDVFHKRYVAYYEVNKADLPFHCPPKDTPKWNHHPKVFLDLEKKGDAKCPYCGAYYVLNKSQ